MGVTIGIIQIEAGKGRNVEEVREMEQSVLVKCESDDWSQAFKEKAQKRRTGELQLE